MTGEQFFSTCAWELGITSMAMRYQPSGYGYAYGYGLLGLVVLGQFGVASASFGNRVDSAAPKLSQRRSTKALVPKSMTIQLRRPDRRTLGSLWYAPLNQ
jgi:hypothetical protein